MAGVKMNTTELDQLIEERNRLAQEQMQKDKQIEMLQVPVMRTVKEMLETAPLSEIIDELDRIAPKLQGYRQGTLLGLTTSYRNLLIQFEADVSRLSNEQSVFRA